jgi:acetyl esterase/lipase
VRIDYIKYAARRGREIQYTPAKTGVPAAPLVVLLGASDVEYPWGFVRPRLHQEGFAFASVRYDLEGDQERAKDIREVAAAIGLLRDQAERRRLDPDRILLIGMGAAAQLALLLATDPAWLEAAGVPIAAVRAAVAVNGTGADIAESMSRLPGHLRGRYRRLFGSDEALHAQLSPSTHLAAPNAGAFLFLFEGHEKRLRAEAESSAARFAAAGLTARAATLPNWRRGERHTYLLGEPGGAGEEMVVFLKAAAGKPSDR